MNIHEFVWGLYETIKNRDPTWEQIERFAKMLESENRTYGIVSYNVRNAPPTIRFHDTWGVKWGGRVHIDVVCEDIHLMLDKDSAPEFIEFLKKGPKKEEVTSR